MATVAPLRSLPAALVVAALVLTTGACDRNKPPPGPPEDTAAEGLVLRYAVPEAPLRQDLELQLTRTRLGLYIEADLSAHAELRLSGEGEDLQTRWAVTEVSALTLDGTVEPDEADRVRVLLTGLGKGIAIGNTRGLLDTTATEADPLNVARAEAMRGDEAASSMAGIMLMTALSELVRLPRLPDTALEPGKPVELAEESETIITDAELVLPTTTVHRFTLRKVETLAGALVAELELRIASVAQPELDPEALADQASADEEPAAQLDSRTEGTLVFDLDRGLPLSLELSRTDVLRIGKQEVEQTLQVHASYSSG